ncbi:MAG: AraC family transcriptional regulator [Lachnospiraceae bacterium]|nr:AraC family transcriptional regulator [Lachnospiraceae bacterium]
MKGLFEAELKRDVARETEPFRFHDSCEIVFVTGGTCTVLREAEMIRAGRGTVLLIPAGVLHMSVALPGAEYARTVIRFDPEAVRPFCGGSTDLLEIFRGEGAGALCLNEAEIRETEPLFRACLAGPDAFGADLRRNLAFLELLVRLGELSREGGHDLRTPEQEGDKNFGRISPIVRYIRDNPAGSLSLEEVAEKFFYNKHYLCRIFKAATGISVGQYIAAVRIRYAADFLRRGCSVQESGRKAGFKNNSNFISTFHKLMDVSPGQYRQQSRRNADSNQSITI